MTSDERECLSITGKHMMRPAIAIRWLNVPEPGRLSVRRTLQQLWYCGCVACDRQEWRDIDEVTE